MLPGRISDHGWNWFGISWLQGKKQPTKPNTRPTAITMNDELLFSLKHPSKAYMRLRISFILRCNTVKVHRLISICALIFVVASATVVLASPTPFNCDEQMTVEFLRNVAGFDMTAYSIFSYDHASSLMPDSQHYKTTAKLEFGNIDHNLTALVTFVDGKFWTYQLDLNSGNLGDAEHTPSEHLSRARRAIASYTQFFAINGYEEFLELTDEALTTGRTVLESSNASLKIQQHAEHSWEATDIQFFAKIDNEYTIPARSLYVTVSKTGSITRIVDNLAIHYVAEARISLSREEAIAKAMPYIDTYAGKFGQKVTSIDASFAFIRDTGSLRGDNFAIYPSWTVKVAFDKLNSENAGGYFTLIWADNSLVGNHGPMRAQFMATNSFDGSVLLFLLPVPLCVGCLLAKVCLGRSRKRRQ